MPIDPALLDAARAALAGPPVPAPSFGGALPPEAMTPEALGYAPHIPSQEPAPIDAGAAGAAFGTPAGFFGALSPPPKPLFADGRQLGGAPPPPPAVGLVHDQSAESAAAARAQLDAAQAPPQAAPARDPLAELLAMSARPAPARGGPGGNVGALGKKLALDQQATLGTYDAQMAARGEGAGLESAKLAEQSHMQQAHALRQETEAQIAHGEQTRALATHEAYVSKTAQMVDDIAAQKIDPNRIFTGNGAQDFTFALGALLTSGIIGADGQSMGAKSVTSAIERNLRAQQANIDNAKGAVAARNAVYGQMREQFGDKQLADEHYRLAGLAAAENRLKGMIAGYDSQSAIAKGNEMLAEIGRERDARQEAITQQQFHLAQQQAAAWGQAQRAAADKAHAQAVEAYKLRQKDQEIAIDAQKADAAGTTARSTAQQKAGELYVPTGQGTGYTARSETEAKDHRTGRAAANELLSLIGQAKQLREQSGMLGRGVANATNGVIVPESAAQLKSIMGQLAAAYKDYKKLGTWDNGSEKLINSITGDATATLGGGADASLDALAMNVSGGLARHALSQGQTQQGAPSGYGAPAAPGATPAGFVERKPAK